MDYKKKYEEAERLYRTANADQRYVLESLFPKLRESEDERISKEIIKYLEQTVPHHHHDEVLKSKEWIAWLEKQGEQSVEPNWCHHKVDLSNCSEEYRKAYYDGWNNCNMQHSQCNSEKNDVIKCLINGMKFYYEGNEEAIWGTDKWSMPVKHIIEVLEKQDEQKSAEWSEEDEHRVKDAIYFLETAKKHYASTVELGACIDWLKSLKQRIGG